MIGFNKIAAISFFIGYFLVGTGFFPVRRDGIFEHIVWIFIGLIGTLLIGFTFGIIKFIKFKSSKNIINKST